MIKQKPSLNLRIIRFMVGDLLEFKIKIPIWLFGFIVLLPLIAYGDLVIFGARTFWGYLGICALELFILFLGFSIASSTYKIKQIGGK